MIRPLLSLALIVACVAPLLASEQRELISSGQDRVFEMRTY